MPAENQNSIPVTINIPLPTSVASKPKQPAAPAPQPAAPQPAPAPAVGGIPPIVPQPYQPPQMTALILPWAPSEKQNDGLDMGMMDQQEGAVPPGTRHGSPAKPRPMSRKRRIVIE